MYNQKVQHKKLMVGELVLRNIVGNSKDPMDGKHGPNWEGPYKFIKLTVK